MISQDEWARWGVLVDRNCPIAPDRDMNNEKNYVERTIVMKCTDCKYEIVASLLMFFVCSRQYFRGSQIHKIFRTMVL